MEWRLLEGVPADQVRELLQVARRRRFSRNEVVFHRDDPGDSLHLISKGRFAIQVMTPLGETATIAIRGPGESFGEMALVGGSAALGDGARARGRRDVLDLPAATSSACAGSTRRRAMCSPGSSSARCGC